MSRVTIILLHHNEPGGHEQQTAVQRLNALLAKLNPRVDYYQLTDLSAEGNAWGGSKVGPPPWGGAFNHLPFPAFAQAVLDAGWEEPRGVQVMVLHEDGEREHYRALTWSDLRAEAGRR